jgi:phosphatidylethanolamine-binding protein (PEBP) family uncharacterized protein
MKLSSPDFTNLDQLPVEYITSNPMLVWSDFPENTNSFLLICVNILTDQIYWATILPSNETILKHNNQNYLVNSFGYASYYPPNDKNTISIYKITCYAIIDSTLEYPQIILKDNVLDMACIKYVYNGFLN